MRQGHLSSKLSHIDERGRARMVDVGEKPVSQRTCVARAQVEMAKETLALITEGRVPKGDVIATARLAGIQAAKRTADWIPLCHPLPLDLVDLEVSPDPQGSCLRIEARAQAQARTGVEMEALVAASAAALTVYDMCKAVDRGMTIQAVRLVYKEGGKSGAWTRPDEPDAPPIGKPR